MSGIAGRASSGGGGDATAANQATIIGHVDGIEATLTTISGNVDQIEGYVDGIEGALTNLNAKEAIVLVEESSTVTYVGKAPAGTATSAASWSVFKMDTTSGLVVTWADSNTDYDNIMDNCASLTYG